MKILKVAVLGANSHEAHIANVRLSNDMIERQSNVKCEGTIHTLSVCMDYADKLGHCRPYLRLTGEVRSLKGNFINGVTEMEFISAYGCPKVEYKYNFTDEELSDLAKKGMFNSNYPVPDLFTNNEFQLPISCDVASVKNAETPIMFIDINDPFLLETNSEQSGYNITKYFEPLDERIEKIHTFSDDDTVTYGKVENMFAEQVLAEQQAEQAALTEHKEIVEPEIDIADMTEEERFAYESSKKMVEIVSQQYNEIHNVSEIESSTSEPEIDSTTEYSDESFEDFSDFNDENDEDDDENENEAAFMSFETALDEFSNNPEQSNSAKQTFTKPAPPVQTTESLDDEFSL